MDNQANILRNGITTGTCAAAAAKAAVAVLLGGEPPETVDVSLPAGERISIPILSATVKETGAEASVVKDAGDDPDITDGVTVKAFVEWCSGGISFCAGAGVGTVTKPGLSVKQGEPAVNPVPRTMIVRSVRELTNRGVRITLSIPGGEELAERTFNPRLGIQGGLSILGTSGRVRPFSCAALRTSLRCGLDVLAATGIKFPILVPGHIGERAARRHFRVVEEQVIEVSNEWGYMLDEAAPRGFAGILVLGHPGKLAKLAAGDWDTHSSRSKSALPFVANLVAENLGRDFSEAPTVEGIFSSLPEIQKKKLGNLIAGRIRKSVVDRLGKATMVAVVLVDMKGNILGMAGDISPWQL